MDLNGKVAVVTGASVSVGREFALEFARQGARVVCAARREDKLKETVALIEAESGQAIHVVADVIDPDQVNNLLAESLQAYGQVDVLVNNAGVLTAVGATWEMNPQVWWRNVKINLFGVFLCSRTFLPHMIERDKGVIINMDGGGGTPGPFIGGSAYGCSKAAILRFTESLAGELERAGSKVMAVCINPGFVRSELSESSVDTPYKAKWLPQVVDRLENDLGVPPGQCAKTAVKLLNILSPELNGRIFKNGTDFQKVAENLEMIKDKNLLVLKYDRLN
jgi:NAD(P)-dependent dehydrogenase (short-subunit alcohol dehydrogenase family)